VLVLDPEVLDEPLELQLVRRVILDLSESAIRKVEIRISPIGHRPGANVVKLFESVIQGFLLKASVFLPGACTIKLIEAVIYGFS
jgi:hypothetical protein